MESKERVGHPGPKEGVLGEVLGDTFQIAILNNLLPRGYRFALTETSHKSDSSKLKQLKRKKMVSSRVLIYCRVIKIQIQMTQMKMIYLY